MIQIAHDIDELRECYDLLRLLRPHLSLEEFLEKTRRPAKAHPFQIVYLRDVSIVRVAGIRIGEWLHSGKYHEIEDQVTDPGWRSRSYGSQLFEWIKTYAEQQQCRQLRLVSGVAHDDAHRFYLNLGMRFEATYFSLDLGTINN